MDKRLGLAGVLCLLVAALSGCDDSDGGGAPQPPAVPPPPVAHAGTDREAWKGDAVMLDGRASQDPEGDPLTFRWRQTEGPAVALSDDRVPQPTFAAPRVTATLRFTLEVSDGSTTSAPDEVVVLVRNRTPYAAAGADQVAPVGHVVTLDASGSGDPDGDPVTATWFQRSGPPVTLVASSAASASFVAPATAAVLEFGVVVSDGEAASPGDALRVAVVDEASNWPPMASAGADRPVARRSVVVLSGSAVDRESDPLTWTWTQVGGPSVALLDADGPSPSFVAPEEEADLEFQLVVADALSTGSDRVTIRVRNQLPMIVSLSLSPEAPVTTDPLVASATVFDADGDPVTLAWEWRRNGAVLGETGSSLPASLTTRDDVIVVRVTASDGGSVRAVAEQTVTILDAPPALALEAPATVAWGEAAAFTATASDPDGDPVGALVLVYGPAGMTLTPAGAGAWTPTLPMFDRTLDVCFAVGVQGSPALLAEGTIRVEDPDRSYPLRRAAMEIPIQHDGLVAIDAEGDGTEELLVASRSGLYELARDGTGYAQRWAYPFAPGAASLASLDAGDVDRDGKPEIFFSAFGWYPSSSPGTLVKLDGAARREVTRTPLACADLEVADLEGDGALELVCLQAPASYGALQQALVLDAATLATRWQTASLALGEGLAIGNVDGDAALEIVTAGGYVFDGASQANEWAYGQAFGVAVDTGDLDGDGVEEIVGMEAWSRFRGFSAVWRTPLWEKTSSGNDALLVADADADGVPEILVGDGQLGYVTAWRYRPATNDLELVFRIDAQGYGVSSMAVADLDGDGALELAWGSAETTGAELSVAGRNPEIAVEWASGPQVSGPFVGAEPARLTAGGAPALLFEVAQSNAGYGGARLVRLDPLTGGVTTSARIGNSWSVNAAIDVADYDLDGVDEIFAATASYYDGYAVAWDFAAGAAEWTSPADFGDGRAMAHADLNGDGAPELVAVNAAGYVHAYDVRNGTLLWKSTGLTGAGVDVEVADIDRDGALELVALTSTRLVVFRQAAGSPVPWLEAASVAVEGMDLALADGDGDGAPELYVLRGSYAGSSVLRFDGALAPLGSFAVRGAALSLFVEDLGFPRQNLVLGKSSFWSYGSIPGALEAVDAITGAQVWESPPLWGYVPKNSLGYVDLDGDGLREIAFGTSSGMHLTR